MSLIIVSYAISIYAINQSVHTEPSDGKSIAFSLVSPSMGIDMTYKTCSEVWLQTNQLLKRAGFDYTLNINTSYIIIFLVLNKISWKEYPLYLSYLYRLLFLLYGDKNDVKGPPVPPKAFLRILLLLHSN